MADASIVHALTYGVTKAEIVIGLKSADSEANLDALDKVIELGPGGASMGVAGEVAELLKSENEDVSLTAAEALGQIGEGAAGYAVELVAMLTAPEVKRRCFAVASLGMMGEAAQEHWAEVARMLSDKSENVRASACIALGSMKIAEAATDLAKCLQDKFPSVVSGAVTALTMVGEAGKQFVQEVAKKLSDKNKEVKSSALVYFTKFDDLAVANKDRIQAICKLLSDEESSVRESAVNLFRELKEKAAPMLEEVAKLLKSQDIRFKSAAALALGCTGAQAKKYGDGIAALVADTTEDRSQLIYTVAGIERKSPAILRIPACAASCALVQIAGDKYSGEIAGLLSSKVPEVKMSAAVALGDMGSSEFADALSVLLDDNAPSMRASAACALGKIAKASGADDKLAEKVAQGLVDDSPIVKATCAEALGHMGDEGAAFSDTVHDLFEDPSKSVRASAVKAIGGMGVKGQTYASHVARMMIDPDAVVRAAAVTTLPLLGMRGSAFADEAAGLLYDQDSVVRDAAVASLAEMGEVGQLYLANAGMDEPKSLTA